MLGHGGYQAYGHGWEHHSRGGLHPHGGGPSCHGGLHPHGGGAGCRSGGHHRHGWELHVGPQSRGWGHFVINPRGHMAQGTGAQIHGRHPIHLHGHTAKDWEPHMFRERCIHGGEDHYHGEAHGGGRRGCHGRGGGGAGRGGAGPHAHGKGGREGRGSRETDDQHP